jgi:exonuclease SbcC
MLISKLELQNVKSYGDLETITFTEGVNAICGPNGAGKSTILEAIGFALFDALNYQNQGQFRREGCKHGHIAVTFLDALDQREYQVVRPLGGGPPYVNDPFTKKRVASGKRDVIDWLKDHLGVSPSTDLKTLFTDAIGIPQGMLTTSFLETPGIRKGKFDPLLQVDEYEAVWEKLRESIRYLEQSKGDKDLEAAEFRSRLDRLPELEGEKTELTKLLADTGSVLEATAEELLTAAAGKKHFDDLEKRVTKLDGLIKQLRERANGINEQISVANSELELGKKALFAVETSQKGYLSFEDAQGQLAELESRRTERDRLNGEASEIERQIALVAQRIDRDQQALASIQDSEEEIASLGPKAAEQEKLEAQLKTVEIAIARLEDSTTRLAEEMEAKNLLQSNLARVQDELKERLQLSTESSELTSARQIALKEIDRLGKKEASLESELEVTRQKSESARIRMAEEEQGSLRLSEAEAELVELENKQGEVESKLESRTVLEGELDTLRSTVSENEQLAASLQTTELQIATSQTALREKIEALARTDDAECPVCQQPLTPEHAAQVTRGYEDEIAAQSQRLAGIAEQRQEAGRLIFSSEQQLESIDQQLSQLPVPGRKAEILEEITGKTEQVTIWRTELKQFAGVSEETESIDRQIQELGAEISQLKQTRDSLDKERTETENQLGLIQERLASLSTPARLEEIEDEITRKISTITQINESIDELGDVAQRQETLRKDLESLGDPRKEMARLSAKAEERPELVKAIAQAEQEQVAVNYSKKAKELELEQYTGLDLALTEQNQIMDSNRALHEQYLSNIQMAEKVPEREGALASLFQSQKDAEDELEATTSSLVRAQDSYDPDRHQKAVAQHASLTALEARLNERIQGADSQLAKVESEIAILSEEKVQLDLIQGQIEELDSLHSTLSYIRKTIREAGPLITRRLVGIISEQANRMYGDIMADHSAMLKWEIDYGITLEHKGEKRDFRQLSGGEQMAAALAVRLALLREMSGIRIAFFDEPTAHLDDERRENLAQQITRIKGFKQLFVISHDDTFERETHHVLRVSKVNDLSHVEVA